MLREPTALGDDKVPLLHLKRKVILLALPYLLGKIVNLTPCLFVIGRNQLAIFFQVDVSFPLVSATDS